MAAATTRPTDPARDPGARWRRLFARPLEQPTCPPLQRTVADLQRLGAEVGRLCEDESILARGQRLQAVRLAYDWVLLDAARALGVTPPQLRAPFTSHDRLMLSVDLTRAGLVW